MGTVGEIADRIGARVIGDSSAIISRVAAVDDVDATTLTFAVEQRYLATALESGAAAILVDASMTLPDAPRKPLVVAGNGRSALAALLQELRAPRPRGPFRHSSAIIAPDAVVADDAYLDAYVYVASGASIGSDCVLGVGSYVGRGSSIGAGSWLHPHARVMDGCIVGKRVVLHAGCVIGSEGFGWAFVDDRPVRIPQAGNVALGDDVEVGANTCIDRAQTGSTSIGEGTKIDNLVQIGHNCKIGRHCAFAALSGLAGSTVIGDYVKVGGQVGFNGHIRVGSRVTIAGGSGIWSDVPDGVTISGDPAREHRERLKIEVAIKNLPKLLARVRALERREDGGS